MLLFSGCDKEEQIPSYIYISEFVLYTKNTNFGSNSHDFVDAWVYANNKLIGVFELPATIPILESGSKQLTIIAGIRKNGLYYEREAYPFLKPYDILFIDLIIHIQGLFVKKGSHNNASFILNDHS